MIVPFFDLEAAHKALSADLADAFRTTINRSQFIMGPELKAFEAEFAHLCEAAYAIGTGNGLDALRLALLAYGIGPGDEVIVPAHTFVATWLAVVDTGARPVGVDVDAATFTLNQDACVAAITPRTRAIIPVHLYGRVAELGIILAQAKSRGIIVIEDAAQAHGATDGRHTAGSIGDAAAFSFYPTKNLGALGDGGAVTVTNAETAERVRMLGNYGSKLKYEHEIAGTNSRLDELQAAILRKKLPRLADGNARRRLIAEAYRERLCDIASVTLPPADEDGRQSVWHLYVIRVRNRDGLSHHLASSGIATLVHYPKPPHLQDALRPLFHRRGDFPVAEAVADTALSLPLWPEMSIHQVDLVCTAIRKWCEA